MSQFVVEFELLYLATGIKFKTAWTWRHERKGRKQRQWLPVSNDNKTLERGPFTSELGGW